MFWMVILFGFLQAGDSVADLYAQQEASLSTQKEALLSAPISDAVSTQKQNSEAVLVNKPSSELVAQPVEKTMSQGEEKLSEGPQLQKPDEDALQKLKAERDLLAEALKKIEAGSNSMPEKKMLGVDFDYDSLSRDEKIGLITSSAGIAFIVLSIISFKLISYFSQRGENVLIKYDSFNSALKESVDLFKKGFLAQFDSGPQALKKQINNTIKLLDKTKDYASEIDSKQAQLLSVEILTSAQKSFTDQLALAKKGPYKELARRIDDLTKPSILNVFQKRSTKNSGKNVLKINSMSKKVIGLKRPRSQVFDNKDDDVESVQNYSVDEEDAPRSPRKSFVKNALNRIFHD